MRHHILVAGLIAATGVGTASADLVDLVVENSGQTWTTRDGLTVGLVGASGMAVNTEVTAGELLAQVKSGDVVGIYNGTADTATYSTGDRFVSNGLDVFESLVFDGPGDRLRGAWYVMSRGTTVFGLAGGGTATMADTGLLGQFESGRVGQRIVVPAPGAAALIGLGGLGVSSRRRRRAG